MPQPPAPRTGAPVRLPGHRPAHLARSGFFDPAHPERPWTGEVRLHRFLVDGDPARERFRLERPVGYWDARLGPVVVPADPAGFSTDLTSVPPALRWLVPTTGRHLPAALVHDGLVAGSDGPPSYLATRPVDRVSADRLFRRALRDLGVAPLRREVMWAGVSVVTALTGPLRSTWRSWLAAAATAALVLVVGTLAVVDLLDLARVLPWMGQRAWWVELLTGAAAALTVPLLAAPLWGRRWRAGAVAGVAAAALLPVTVAVLLASASFAAVDALAGGRPRRAARWAVFALALAGTVAAVAALAR
ncbi:DUF1353 domain-containing protein [Kineococcus auxinigenes]|uniref:DUF1353 domain-containing protein n=1 Tax=unclassified Kineococcus TaxID=2621656 RepID=UPI003D7D5AD2